MPSDSLESAFSQHTSSHGLAGADLTKLPLNGLTSKQKSNCNARLVHNGEIDPAQPASLLADLAESHAWTLHQWPQHELRNRGSRLARPQAASLLRSVHDLGQGATDLFTPFDAAPCLPALASPKTR